MDNAIFSKEKVNTGRQKEIDLLKAYSIIMMIITHCIDDLYNYESDVIAALIDDKLAQLIGAQAFMICMGLGMIYSKKAAAKDFLSRGFAILITGQLLNIFRYAVPGIAFYYLLGAQSSKASTFLTFSSDILQFAGLFFICMALFTYLKLSNLWVFIISVAANIVGTLTYGAVSTGSYALDQFLGMFIFTETESYFPLIHWMVFPAFGLLLGEILTHVRDKKKFYSIVLIPSSLVFILYFIVSENAEQSLFTLFTEWQSFCYIRIVDVIPSVISCMAVLSVCYFVSEHLSERAGKCVSFVSKNINRYYCVHYIFVMPVSMYLMAVRGDYLNSGALVWTFAAVVIALTSVTVYIYDRYYAKKAALFFGRNKVLWTALVIVMSIATCVWAYHGTQEFPNLVNDYVIGE